MKKRGRRIDRRKEEEEEEKEERGREREREREREKTPNSRGRMPTIKVGLINLVIMTGGHLSVFLRRDSSY